MIKQQIQSIIQNSKDVMIAYRRDFHQYPETGWTEFRTAAAVAAKLKEYGYTVKTGQAALKKTAMMGVPAAPELESHLERALRQGADAALARSMAGGLTGVVADLKCGEGPTVALRFDLDANDVQEACDERHRPYRESFASQNPGVMHACGHDGHIAIGLGAAAAIAKLKEHLKGTVRLIFEPGEEGSRGAKAMVEAGAVDGVDYIAGLHIGFQAKRSGQIICSTGKFLATTKWDVVYRGKSAHAGAAPEEGKNALLAAASAVLNLHAIPRHGQGATRITVGTLTAGQGRNVIPPNARLQMETRGETSELDGYMAEKARRIIEASAHMYDIEYEINQVGGTKSGESSPEMMAKVKRIAQDMPWFTAVEDYSAFGATEDFSHMMSVVQGRGGLGVYVMLGSDLKAGHHNNYFDFDESCLVPGAELMVKLVFDILGEP